MKKITLYRPIIKTTCDDYILITSFGYHADKDMLVDIIKCQNDENKVVGWEEKEVEVKE